MIFCYMYITTLCTLQCGRSSSHSSIIFYARAFIIIIFFFRPDWNQIKDDTTFLLVKCHQLDMKTKFLNSASFVLLKQQTKKYFFLTNKIFKQTTQVCFKTWSRRAFSRTVDTTFVRTFSLLFHVPWHWWFHYRYTDIDSSIFCMLARVDGLDWLLRLCRMRDFFTCLPK